MQTKQNTANRDAVKTVDTATKVADKGAAAKQQGGGHSSDRGQAKAK